MCRSGKVAMFLNDYLDLHQLMRVPTFDIYIYIYLYIYNRRMLATTRNNNDLKQMLTSAKFEMHPVIKQCMVYIHVKISNASYIQQGIILHVPLSNLRLKITCIHNRMFTCSGKGVIYMLICNKSSDLVPITANE